MLFPARSCSGLTCTYATHLGNPNRSLDARRAAAVGSVPYEMPYLSESSGGVPMQPVRKTIVAALSSIATLVAVLLLLSDVSTDKRRFAIDAPERRMVGRWCIDRVAKPGDMPPPASLDVGALEEVAFPYSESGTFGTRQVTELQCTVIADALSLRARLSRVPFFGVEFAFDSPENTKLFAGRLSFFLYLRAADEPSQDYLYLFSRFPVGDLLDYADGHRYRRCN